ncbi:MAG: alkaline phosphatase D family protein [Bryobacteraceae bacterium]|nr:alkaline phosphatase D family protein [Bryobacteraceae bacterium]
MTRRDLLRAGAGASFGWALNAAWPLVNPVFTADPFSAGVASGDPLPDGMILWTKLIADPRKKQSWQSGSVAIYWTVASDALMRNVVAGGTAYATPDFDHALHIDVRGLAPNRWYWYQFSAPGFVSDIGRTKTAPATAIPQVNFALASCQNYEHGYYNAYRHLANEDLDFVLFLGDYIYENASCYCGVRRQPTTAAVTLADYRNRYALYRTDADLRRAHQMFPWIVTWDDHDVANNYAGLTPATGANKTFAQRRAAAYQAFYEWLPIRLPAPMTSASARIYRRLDFGPMMSMYVLDCRQYRSVQACGNWDQAPCAGMYDASRTMLGAAQEQWLTAEMAASNATWDVLASSIMLTKFDEYPGNGEIYNMDTWSGYEASRLRLLNSFAQTNTPNPVVVSGDSHASWACDLKLDFRNVNAPAVGTEFAGTSISSDGDGSDTPSDVAAQLLDNPQVKFYSGKRGYVRCAVTPDRFQADYRVVDRVTVPASFVSTKASYLADRGRPGAQRY